MSDELWHVLSADGTQPPEEFPEQPDPDDFNGRLNNIFDEWHKTNESFGQGLESYMTQHRITGVTGEVWDSDGNWAFTLAFDDGSTITGEVSSATGYIAEIVQMAGGNPTQD